MIAYTEGCVACLQNKPADANPYRMGTDAHKSWQAGWVETNKRVVRSIGWGKLTRLGA